MAEKESKKEEKAPDAEAVPGKKSKKKLFLLIGLLVLVAGGGGGAAFFLLKGKKTDHTATDAHAPEAAAAGEHKEEHAPADTHAADAAPTPAPAPDDAHKAVDAHGKPKKDAGKKDPHAADGHGDAKSAENAAPPPNPAPGFGDTYAFKPFHLNLGNPLENRYVRLEISTEYKGGDEQKREIEARLPQLRDAVISVVQTKTREFILSATGKDRLRYEITTQLNQLMTKKIENVYITDLIIE